MAQDCDQRLTVNGIVIGETVADTPRWQITSFADAQKMEVRGDDRQVPYLNGRLPYPRRIDRVRMLFPMVIQGAYAAAFTRLANNLWAQQRVDNVAALLAAWRPGASGSSATTGEVTVTWRQPSGTTKTALGKVILPLGLTDPGTTEYFTAVLDLNVCTGEFV